MKIKLVGIVVGIVIIAILAGNLSARNKKNEEHKFVFTYAENQPEDYPTTLGGYKFAELVKERTNGKIQIIIQANGILGDEKEVVKQIEFGGIDFARVSISTLSDNIPKFNVLQMPYLYNDSKHMWKVLEGKIGDDFLNSFDGTHIVALSWYDAGARNFYSSEKPIKSVEDMSGLRIRVLQSDLMVRMVEALGATAVPITYDNVYSSLEKDIVDGAENNWPSYEASSHYEVAKYYTIDEHTRVPEIQICAQSTWDQLSKQEQDIIRECAKESALYERALWGEREKESERIAIEKGVEVIALSEEEKERFREAVKGVYEEFCSDYMDIIDEIIAEGK